MVVGGATAGEPMQALVTCARAARTPVGRRATRTEGRSGPSRAGALDGAPAAGPVVTFERFAPTDGDPEDRVRVVLPDGTTVAATGVLDVSGGDDVAASGSREAVRRASGATTTPYAGDDAGVLVLEASCG